MTNPVIERQSPAAFVATLGLQPQIITRALDRLRMLEPRLEMAIIIHTSTYRPHPQWASLASFVDYLDRQFAGIEFKLEPIARPGESALDDVDAPEEAEIAFRVIYNVTRELKRQGYRLHSLIAGGRKSIIIYSVLSAQLLFDADDRLWHLFSSDEHNRELGLRPHVTGDIAQLIEIPVLFISRMAPLTHALILHSDDPTYAMRLYKEQENADRLVQQQRFFDKCESIDQQILLLRYQEHSNAVVAARVHLSESAVSNRLKEVARRYFRDPDMGHSRYARLPDNPQRVILLELSPILRRMLAESPSPQNPSGS
jgi:CRISPR-associated protein (TIGR02584 family)